MSQAILKRVILQKSRKMEVPGRIRHCARVIQAFSYRKIHAISSPASRRDSPTDDGLAHQSTARI